MVRGGMKGRAGAPGDCADDVGGSVAYTVPLRARDRARWTVAADRCRRFNDDGGWLVWGGGGMMAALLLDGAEIFEEVGHLLRGDGAFHVGGHE